MKKITLMLFMMLLSVSAFAQLPQEAFETWPVGAGGWSIQQEGPGAQTWAQGVAGGPFEGINGTNGAYAPPQNTSGAPNIEWLITPAFQVPANAQLYFMSKWLNGGDQGSRVDVRISTNPDPSVLSAYTSLIDADGWSELEINPVQTTWTEKILPIPATYLNQTVHIAFVYRSANNGDRWIIDNVSAETQCQAPGAITISAHTTVGFTVAFAQIGTNTNYELEIVEEGEAQTGVATHSFATAPPFIITDLDPGKIYRVYARTMCSPTNPSSWAGPQAAFTYPTGSTCASPIEITTPSYQTTDTTANYPDLVNGTAGAGCNGITTSLNGNDVIYRYTASFTGPISIIMSNSGANTGLFLYDECADIGVACIGGATGNTANPPSIPSFNVTTGEDYYIVISTSGATQSTAYTLTIQPVSCDPPTNGTIPVVNPTDAQLSWTNPTGATSWQVVVQPAGTGLPPVTPAPGSFETATTNTNYPVQAVLNQASNYEFWVRSDCNNGTFSAWAGPFTFSTPQIPAVLNFTEDWENDIFWSLQNGSFVNRWHVGTAANNGGTKSLYVSNDNGVTNAYTLTATSSVFAYRDIEIPAGTNEINFSFDWKSQGQASNDYLRVWSVPTTYLPGTGAITVGGGRVAVSPQLQGSANWTNASYILNTTAYDGETRRFIIEWRNNNTVGTQSPAAIDNININIITCSVPRNLAVTAASIQQYQATITWTAAEFGTPQYDYYYSTSDTAPTAATAPNNTVGGTSTIIPGLLPSTTYYVWLRSNCGPGDVSTWIGPIEFHTLQEPAPLNYNETFEGVHQWTFRNGTQANKWVVGTAVNNGGTKSLYISNNNGTSNAYDNATAATVHAYRDIQMPAIVEQITVSFDWLGMGDANDRIRVYLVNDDFVPTPGTQITPNAQRILLVNDLNQSGTWTNNFTLHTATAFANQVKRVVIEWRNDNAGGAQPPAAIDNFNISVVTCPAPSALAVSNITATTADISWTGPVTVTPTYDYYVNTRITAFPIGTTVPTGNVAATTVTLDDELAGNTNFYVWVRSNCGNGDNSPWIGPLQFGLPQTPATLNYNDTLEPAINWTIVNGTQTNKWVVGTATSSSPSTSLYVSNNNGIFNNYTHNTASTVHAYRDIQMPSAPSDIALTFQWKAAGQGTNDRLRVWIVPQTFTPTPGTVIANAANRTLIGEYSSATGAVWNNATAVLAETANVGLVRRLVFEWRNDASVGTNPAAAVDNINVRIITCPAVTNLVAAGTGVIGDVLLTWTPVGTETQWEVVLQPENQSAPGDNPPLVIPVSGTPSYLATNLPAGVFYNFYVRPVCAADDKGLWAGPGAFSIFAPPACAAVQLLDQDLAVIAPGTNLSICPGEDACIPLNANFLQTGSTSSYQVEEIDYTPQFPFTGGIQMNVSIDDSWSPVFTFPADFNFCFYGNKQTRMQVGSNGVVSFNANYAVAQAGTCPYLMNNNVPNTGFPIKNAIFGVYQDIDPAINNSFASPSINYQILGTYPCRAIVINFSEVAQWGSTCNNDPVVGAQTSQIVIYEISNIVEVYIKRRVPCLPTWGGDGVVGLINATGSAGIAPAGYNVNDGWSATEKAFRFTPNGPSNVVFEWFKNNETIPYSTNPNITICVTEETTMTARATYSGCGTNAAVLESKVIITPEEPIIITQTTDLTECTPGPGQTATFDLMDGIENGIANPQDYTFTFYNTALEADAGVVGTELPVNYDTNVDKTIYVRVQLTGRGCYVTDEFDLKLRPLPQYDLTQDFTLCQGNSEIIAVTNPSYDASTSTVTYVWSHDTLGTLPDTGTSISATVGGTYTVAVTVDGCTTTKSVLVTEVVSPTPDNPADVEVCDQYVLPALSADNKYFTGSMGTGTELLPNAVITSTQTIYVFVAGAAAGCNAENSFIVTIVPTPQIAPITPVQACQTYTLPVLPVGNYFDAPGGTGNMLNAGDLITASTTLYVYASAGTVPCVAEQPLAITITPAITADIRNSDTVCAAYELTPLNPNNTYYTGTGGTGQVLAPGTFITETQTVYIYAEDGDCNDETSFTITVIDEPLDVTISEGCEGGSYVLGVIFANGELNYNAGSVSYAWSRTPGGSVIATTPTVVAADEGMYYVRVTPTGSSVVCYGEGELDVIDNTCLIQKGISPNNDGLNDSFDLTAFGVRKLSIFNRYGKEVYSFGNYTNQWHGQSDGGSELPTGTYFYTFERENGENKTGWVYINREQ